MIKSFSKPISQWDSVFLDSILLEGNEFYKEIIHKSNIGIRHLGIDDLIGTHIIFEKKLFVDLFEMFSHAFSEDPELNQYIRNCHNGHINFDDLLYQCQSLLSSNCNFGLFICNGFSYGLIKNLNIINIFDSHSKDINGNSIDNGTASLRSFITLKELTNFLLKINPQNAFYQVYYLTISFSEVHDTLVKSLSSMSIENSNYIKI